MTLNTRPSILSYIKRRIEQYEEKLYMSSLKTNYSTNVTVSMESVNFSSHLQVCIGPNHDLVLITFA